MRKYKVTLQERKSYHSMSFAFDDFIQATSFIDMALETSGDVEASIYIIKEKEEEGDDE